MDYPTVVRSICLQPYAAECRFGLKIHNDLEEMYMLIATKEKEVELFEKFGMQKRFKLYRRPL